MVCLRVILHLRVYACHGVLKEKSENVKDTWHDVTPVYNCKVYNEQKTEFMILNHKHTFIMPSDIRSGMIRSENPPFLPYCKTFEGLRSELCV